MSRISSSSRYVMITEHGLCRAAAEELINPVSLHRPNGRPQNHNRWSLPLRPRRKSENKWCGRDPPRVR